MERLTLGTKEYLVINIIDRLQHITTLDGTSPKFDIRERGSDTWELQNQNATTEGMTVYCLVDTSDWNVGTYELFLDFTSAPENPRLGPFDFYVA